MNVKHSENLGYAVGLPYNTVTKETVLSAVKKIFSDPKYETNNLNRFLFNGSFNSGTDKTPKFYKSAFWTSRRLLWSGLFSGPSTFCATMELLTCGRPRWTSTGSNSISSTCTWRFSPSSPYLLCSPAASLSDWFANCAANRAKRRRRLPSKRRKIKNSAIHIVIDDVSLSAVFSMLSHPLLASTWSLKRTTEHHPACNGTVERLHRTLKAALMAHDNDFWSDFWIAVYSERC